MFLVAVFSRLIHYYLQSKQIASFLTYLEKTFSPFILRPNIIQANFSLIQ